MRRSAFTVGLIGAMLGIPFSLVLGAAGALAGSAMLGLLAVALPIVGLVGASLTLSKPAMGATLLALAGLGGLLALQLWYILPAALLLIAALMSWNAARDVPATQSAVVDRPNGASQ